MNENILVDTYTHNFERAKKAVTESRLSCIGENGRFVDNI